MATNQSAPGLKRVLSSKFVGAEKCKPGECLMYVWILKVFTNGVKICLPLQDWVEKTVHWVETDSLVKKKFQVKWQVKEGHARSYHYFLEKGATVNCFLLPTP